MATLALDNRSLKIVIDGQAIALYEADERRGSLPIKLIDRVIIQGDVTLSTGVLTRIAENGATVVMLSKRNSRRIAFLLGPAHNDAAIRLAQAHAVLDKQWCIQWARRQIRSKLRAQLRILRLASEEKITPAARLTLKKSMDNIQTCLDVLVDPMQSIDLPQIRGLEGAAARAYFQGFSALFPPSLGFSGRNRRPPRDPVNACLSLSYTLLHFNAIEAAHRSGLDPLLGFYHRPSFGRESLASDLIEPLRPLADNLVLRLFKEHKLRPEHFGREHEACLLGKKGREIFYRSFEDFAEAPRRLLQRQCRLIASHFRTRGGTILEDDEEECA